MDKVIFIDIDGTLLDYENKLPASADRAIKEARKNGHRVYICTGRSEVEVYDYIWDIGLDGWLVEMVLMLKMKILLSCINWLPFNNVNIL